MLHLVRTLLLVLVPAAGCLDREPAELLEREVAPDVDPPCTYYVSNSGDNAGPGTSTAPWRTIQHAVGGDVPIGPGSVVCVAPGTYMERVRFGVSGEAGAPITLRGLLGITSGPVIDGTLSTKKPPLVCDPALWILDDSHIRITNLAFTHRGVPRFPIPEQCTSTGIRIGNGSVNVDDITIDHVTVSGIRTADPRSLGIPIAAGMYSSVVGLSHVSITDSVITDNDTIAEGTIVGSGTSGVALQVSAVNIAGNARDWLVARNVFDDEDTGGVEISGEPDNQQPTGGVISDNWFRRSGRLGVDVLAPFPSAVYNQGGRNILIERNFFDHPGNAINVKTEPRPISYDPPRCAAMAPATHTWIRNNIIVGSRGGDLLAGADANPTEPCPYGDVDGVYVTNNTIVRDRGGTAAFVLPHNGSAGLVGDNKFADNIVITPGLAFQVVGDPPFVSNHNYLVSPGELFFWHDGVRLRDDWRMVHDQQSQIRAAVAPNLFAVEPPIARADFALSSTITPPHDNGAPYSPNFGPRPTTPAWATEQFGAYTPASELDHYGGPRELGGTLKLVRRDIGADER